MFGRLHVLPVLTELLRAVSDIDIRLSHAVRLLHLQDEHVDLAGRIGDLPESNLRAIKVASVRRVVCASPAYLATQGIPLAPQGLARHACISVTALGNADR